MATNAAEELSTRMAKSLQVEFEGIGEKVRRLVQDLSIDQLWQRPYPYGNSVGHLILHLTGNLSYYVGTQIAGSGYVRNRPLEFTDSTRRPKDDVLRAFDEALSLVVKTLAAQTPEDWQRPYEAVGTSITNRLGTFLHCAAHADHHAGQIIYLCKELGRTES